MTLSVATLFVGCRDDDPAEPKLTGGSAGKPAKGGASGKGGMGGHAGKASSAGDAGSGEPSGASGLGPSSGASGGSGGSTDVGGSAGDQPASGGSAGNGGSAGRGRSSGGKSGSSAGSPQNGGEAGGGPGPQGLYVAVDGDDGASGLRDDPLATLAQAASMATAGDSIVFLDGDHVAEAPDDGIVIPDGVNLIAEHSGAVTISSPSYVLLNVAGDSTIEGIHFTGDATVVSATGPGNIVIRASTFTDCTDLPLVLRGDANVTLDGSPEYEWSNCPGIVSLTYGGALSVNGGIFRADPAAQGSFFNAFGAPGRIALDGVTLIGDASNALDVEAGASATIVDSTFQLGGVYLITAVAVDVLTISGSEIDGLGVAGNCISAYTDGVGEISLTDTSLHDCYIGISGQVPAELGLSGVDIDTVNGALYLGQGTTLGGTIDISDSTLKSSFETAAMIGDGNTVGTLHLTIRNTTIAGGDCLALSGDPAPSPNTWDLGTLADPGGNTLQSNAAGFSLAVATGSGSFVSAVGNTWHPGLQGADTSGHYAVTNPGEVLDVTSGTGRNYQITSGTLRLAEKAP